MRRLAEHFLLIVATTAGGYDVVAQDRAPVSNGSYQYYNDGTTFRLSDEHRNQQPPSQPSQGQAMRPNRVIPAAHAKPIPPPPANALETNSALPLAPQKSPGTENAEQSKTQTPTRALTTVIGSLAIVLGLFLLVIWVTRRTRPKGAFVLPKDVVEVLGRAPLASRQQLHLVRLGNKLLLLSVNGDGARALSEITDQDEVDRLAGLCEQSQPGSITSTFRQVLSQLGGQSTPRDDGDAPENTDDRRQQRSRTA